MMFQNTSKLPEIHISVYINEVLLEHNYTPWLHITYGSFSANQRSGTAGTETICPFKLMTFTT
jgi:hypothetical protein